MTSNVGAETLKRNRHVGFTVGGESGAYSEMKTKVLDELKRTFRPEFLNRIDEIIVFHELKTEQIEKIVGLLASDLEQRLENQGITLTLTDAAKKQIAKEGYDPEYGARPLKRALQKKVEDRLSEELLKGNISKGSSVVVDYKDGQFVVTDEKKSVSKTS